MVGTLAYMAPEVLMNKNYDNKVDSWSLGIVLYELLTNEHPYIEHQDNWPNFSRLQNNLKNLKH